MKALMMNRLLALFLFGRLFVGVSCALAQSADTAASLTITSRHLNVAYETVFITRTSRAYNEVLPNLARRAKEKLIERYPALEPDIVLAVDEVALSLAAQQGELDLLIARSWAEKFSEDELREISAFYATPTGTKLAKTNTELIAAGLDIARQWGVNVGVTLVTQVQERLKALGHKL